MSLQLVGLNSAATSTRAAVEMHTVVVNPAAMLTPYSEDTMNTRMKDFIEEKIQIFSSRIGYPLNFSAEQVLTAVDIGIILFQGIRELQRLNNVADLRDVFGKPIGSGIKQKVQAGGQLHQTGNWNYTSNSFTGSDLRVFDLYSPSNSVWANIVGTMVDLVRVPQAWLRISDYLASNYFTNIADDDTGVSEMYEFGINTIYRTPEATDWKSVIDQLTDQLQTIYAENPLIVPFMEQELGLLRHAGEYDYTRDLAKRSWNIIDDPALIDAIACNPTTIFRGDAVAFQPEIKDFEWIRSPQNVINIPSHVESIINLPIDHFIEHFLFSAYEDGIMNNTKAFLLPLVRTVDTDGTAIFKKSLPVFGPLDWEGNVPALASMATRNHLMSFPFSFGIKFTENNTIEQVVVSGRRGYNTYSISEDDYFTAEFDYKMGLFISDPSVFMTTNLMINRYNGNTGLKHQGSVSTSNDTHSSKSKKNTNKNYKNNNKRKTNSNRQNNKK